MITAVGGTTRSIAGPGAGAPVGRLAEGPQRQGLDSLGHPAAQRLPALRSARSDEAARPTLPAAPSLADSIRPNVNRNLGNQPLRVMESLRRLGQAIAKLDTSQDALLRTADHVLAEEQLRLELLRQRLQMILEG